MLTAFRDISAMCEQFSLPKTIGDIAKQVHKRSDEEKPLRGDNGSCRCRLHLHLLSLGPYSPQSWGDLQTSQVSKKTPKQAFSLTLGASTNSNHNVDTTAGGGDLSHYCSHLYLPTFSRSVVTSSERHASSVSRMGEVPSPSREVPSTSPPTFSENHDCQEHPHGRRCQ